MRYACLKNSLIKGNTATLVTHRRSVLDRAMVTPRVPVRVSEWLILEHLHWNRKTGEWEMLLCQKEESVEWKIFTREALTRSRVEDR